MSIKKMEKGKNWFILLIQLLTVCSVRANYDPKCKEYEAFNDRYFEDLEVYQDIGLHQKNNLLTILIELSHPSYIKGWTVRGRSGPNDGPPSDRRGLILEYNVEYGNRDGAWVPIKASEQRNDFFTDTNLTYPEYETKVDLCMQHPLKTKYLRFFPQLWDGAPYMAVRVTFCKDLSDTSHWEEMKSNTKLLLQALKNVENTKNNIKIKRKNKRSGLKTKGDVCHTKVEWRYNGERPTKDKFSASHDPSSAKRLKISSIDHPYLFPSTKRQYAQIKFAAQSHITHIRVAGRSNAKEYGAVSQFSLFFRDEKSGRWRYYCDKEGNRRIFDTRGKNRMSAMVPQEYKLPMPINTKILRVYPHKWINKPYLAMDVRACYLSDPYPEFKHCSDSLLSQDGSLLSISFDNLKKKSVLTNYQMYRTLELENIEDDALVMGVKVRVMAESSSPDFVKTFVMQYFNEKAQWKNVVDDDGIIKVFHAHAKTEQKPLILKFSDPVETGFLRVYPESWTGNNPVLYIDILGCTNY